MRGTTEEGRGSLQRSEGSNHPIPLDGSALSMQHIKHGNAPVIWVPHACRDTCQCQLGKMSGFTAAPIPGGEVCSLTYFAVSHITIRERGR